MTAGKYLLDTNVVSALVRDPHGPIAERIARVGEQNVCTSIVVTAELQFGARKSGSPRLQEQLEKVLAAMDIQPLEPPVDAEYAVVRHELEGAGTPIGPNDLLIAAHARTLGLTVVTANTREFARVPEIAVENWLADGPPVDR